ncbi:MAG: DUF1501 domain-containing protein [Bacteroidota bacterium]
MSLHHSHSNGRKGDRLAHGHEHAKDHGLHSRRGFLRNMGLVGGAGLLLNKVPVQAMQANAWTQALTNADSDRVLVIIRLKGGNDGLNTFIPVHDFGTYQSIRPDIYIPVEETINFSSSLAVHPQLSALQGLWNEGAMKVVQNVGYPEQNLSHFRGSDIWASSSDADEVIQSGWLGRMLDNQYPDFLINPPDFPPAIQIGGASNLLFNNDDGFNYAMSTENPQQLYQIAQSGQLYDVENLPDCAYGEQVEYLRAVANTTFAYSAVIADAYDDGQNSADYMNNRLGDQLALVARLIRGGLPTRLYMVELDGFDTHANQPDLHAYLLQTIAENVNAFFTDLAAGGDEQRVLTMTISEFGRRPEQNGSTGTDHGAAAPLMLFGPGLNGNGLLGGLADLGNLDNVGNLIYQVDYRAIYATVLDYWLCVDGMLVDDLLGSFHERIEGLGLFCQSTSTTEIGRVDQVKLVSYLSGGDLAIDFELERAGEVTIRLHDIVGRVVSSPYQGRHLTGEQTVRLPLSSINWTDGVYVVSLETGGRVYSRQVGLFRR